MHSKKISVIIGLIIIAINTLLMIIYLQKQWKYTTEYTRSLYKEIKKPSASSQIK